ncbi:MAG TPA: hypothetical protein ENI88_11525 [Desulfobulbus sp.]|nr:hypothetical protein [Desulfobulbus sp.]
MTTSFLTGSRIISLRKESPFLALFLLFIGLRIWYLLSGGVAVDSDEAIVGLMGRHILAGQQVLFFLRAGVHGES